MSLLDRLKRWAPLLSFQIGLGESNQVCAKIAPEGLGIGQLEIVRFWAFATARILYDIWYANTPRAFLALNLLGMTLERDLDPATDCLRRAQLSQFRYVPELLVPSEQIVGEYLGRNDAERTIRFRIAPAFEENMPTPLAMVSAVVLLQHVLGEVHTDIHAVQALSQTGRNLITQFGADEWAGTASREKLPQAAFNQALSSVKL